MPDRRLTAAFAGVAEALLPDDDLAQSRANAAVIRRDATVNPAAIGAALVLTRDFDIPGALVIAADAAQHRRAQQDIAVRQLRADAKTPPAGGECTLVLYADGVHVASVSIAAGATAGVSSGLNVPVDAGALLTIDVNAANGAADVSVMAAYRPR